MLSLHQSPHHPPAIAQDTPSPSPIRLAITRPASSQAATRPTKRRWMAERALQGGATAGEEEEGGDR